MIRKAKHSSAADHHGSGLLGFVFAPRALAALATIAALVFTAAPALAAPTVTTPVVSGVSYTTAHVSSEVNPVDGFSSYRFQVSTNGTDWTPNTQGFFFSKETLNTDLTGLEDGTEYFVRLIANKGFSVSDPPEVISPGPNPSFTTLTADPPTIPGAVGASSIFSTSATGSAEVNRPVQSDDVKCHFEYVTDEDFGATGFAGATARDCAQNPIEAADGGTDKKVTAPLGCTNPVLEGPQGNCLKPGTTYRLRLVAENAAGEVTKEAASTFTTLPPVAKPTALAADDATEVGTRSAQATGELERPAGEDPALDVSCRFEYVTDEQFSDTGFAGAGQAPCAENPVTSPSPDFPAVTAEVTAQLSGLEPGTTYHLRLAAENGGGVDTKESAGTFTTVVIVHPTLTTDPVTDLGYTRALVTGEVDPGDQGINAGFEWSTDPSTEGWNNPIIPFVSGDFSGEAYAGSPAVPMSRDLTDLRPGTTYTVRAAGYDFETFSEFRSPEPYLEFTTKGTSAPPIVSLDPVADLSATGAHFSGTVDANAPAEALSEEARTAYRTVWHFECTPECKDVNGNLIGGTVEAEDGTQSVATAAEQLDANTFYEVKLVATNVLGTVETPVESFSTPLVKPAIKLTAGASDGKGGYTLQGVVNPQRSPVTDCKFLWGPNAPAYAFSADCSPDPGAGSKPVTVEAHLTGLNPGVVYHVKLVATNSGGQAESGDQEFIPTLDAGQSCPNEQIRTENSSLLLPECRAFEQVSSPLKSGTNAIRLENTDDVGVLYGSTAGNIANSGSGEVGGKYVAVRTSAGWETIPNLNGPYGSPSAGPNAFSGNLLVYPRPWFSADLRSSLWEGSSLGDRDSKSDPYLRVPDGSFERIGKFPHAAFFTAGASDDLSHVVFKGYSLEAGLSTFGLGLVEWIGTGNTQPPRRVDVDNSGNPISECHLPIQQDPAESNAVSSDGSVIVFTVAGGCGDPNPAANEIWARVDGTSSYRASTSHCNRTAADPGGLCNAPADVVFAAATPDGSRVFFTTTQQLVDGDVDQTNDVYAYDLPTASNPNPSHDLIEISGARGGAKVEEVTATSEDGSTVYFLSPAVLADNPDALGQAAVAGGKNLYVWRQDANHPAGQTKFITRMGSEDGAVGTTPDGRYLILRSNIRLTDTDTDTAIDVFRYDADTGEVARISTNNTGVGGNSNGFDVPPQVTFTDAGDAVAFATTEPLLAAVDGNGESDVYLWRQGRTYLISSGDVGGAGSDPSIDASGQNLYFQTAEALTPSDGDSAVDVYDARVNGGFSAAEPPRCVGEGCQATASPQPASEMPASSVSSAGNPSKPRRCPKGKVKKHGKCVKKKRGHGGRKHHPKKHRQASAKTGDGK